MQKEIRRETADPWRKGLQLRDSGQRARAIPWLEQAAREHPGEALRWYELAVTLDRLSRERAAIPRYRRALRLGLPAELAACAWAYLGSSLRKTGCPAAALRCFSRARQAGFSAGPLERWTRLARAAMQQR